MKTLNVSYPTVIYVPVTFYYDKQEHCVFADPDVLPENYHLLDYGNTLIDAIQSVTEGLEGIYSLANEYNVPIPKGIAMIPKDSKELDIGVRIWVKVNIVENWGA